MLYRQLFEPESCTYTYLLAARPGGEALLIDPVLSQTPRYLALIEAFELRLVVAIDTHTHADHVTALGALRDTTACLTRMGEFTRAECVSSRFVDGEIVAIDGVRLLARATPGHTDDSFSLVTLQPGTPRVFTGDALLIGGTGRTDFQNGDARAAWRSLQDVLLQLPDETRVCPAHDYRGQTESTIGHERRTNPRLQVADADEYAALMAALKLPAPKLMDVAVAANLRCGRSP